MDRIHRERYVTSMPRPSLSQFTPCKSVYAANEERQGGGHWCDERPTEERRQHTRPGWPGEVFLFENSDTPGWSDHVYAPPLPLYKHGQTALSHACACGRTEAARFLIENGAQLDEPDLVSGSSNCIAFSMFIFDDDHDRLTV